MTNDLIVPNDISVVPVGEKFLFVFPTAQKQKMDSLLALQMPVHSPSDKEPAPAHSFPGIYGLRQLIAVYGQLCGETY